jgi:hypothetical protein
MSDWRKRMRIDWEWLGLIANVIGLLILLAMVLWLPFRVTTH